MALNVIPTAALHAPKTTTPIAPNPKLRATARGSAAITNFASNATATIT